MVQLSNFNFSEKSIRILIANGDVLNSGIYQKLTERRFYINEADIPRNILFNWNKNKLLPYDNTEIGWQKFSLLEFTWLKVLQQLRSFGLSLEKLKNLKTQLFAVEIDVYKEFLINSLHAYDGEIANKKAVLEVFSHKNIPEIMWKEVFDELQMSVFSMLILQILVCNQNLCLVIDEKTNCSFVVLDDSESANKKQNDELLNDLTNSSFIVVNVRQILQRFFSNEKITYDNEYLLSFLNKKERKIIELLRKGEVKEVKIKFVNNEIDLIECVKNENPEIAIHQLGRGFKKSDYKDVIVKVRDGKVIHYQSSELTKFKK